ncbi:murein biosynthesis integral membrane protein MurJ [Kitasatospora sp. NPDC057015]|uniref:murein biosynthesis integral membrane protein MurJ n=1 Tax=Kitasatospora sp. NPDC057015 TaxID=3346001 RepID=UPI003642CDED
MSGPREERAQSQAGGPQPAETPGGDWYVADTYAQDPYAADAYAGYQSEQDPYGVQDGREDGPPPAYDVPPQLPPQAGGYPTPVPAPAPPVPPVQPGWDTPATWRADAPRAEAAGGPANPDAPQHGGHAPAAVVPEAPPAAGSPGAGPGARWGQWQEPARAESPWNSETTEYVGVDALFGGGPRQPEPQPAPQAAQQPLQQPVQQPAQHPGQQPAQPGPYQTGPYRPGAGPVDAGPVAAPSGPVAGHGYPAPPFAAGPPQHPGQHPGQGGQFVPPIEFDPPLSEQEATMQVAAVQLPPAVEPLDEIVEEEREQQQAPRPTGGGGGGGKVAGLLNSSAIMAAGTLVSRGTGFVRTMVIVAAIGAVRMGDSYNAANTLPTLLYILIGGGALNAVFVPQLVRSMKHDDDGGAAYANRLLTLVIVGLAGVSFVAVLGAPILVQLIAHALTTDQASADTTVALARYCLPTIFFMGIHVVMGQILNARGRFGAMMWTPVLNNIVVIFTFGAYIWVYGGFSDTGVNPATISPEGVRLLGLGTLLGLAVQALAMIPYLRAAGFGYRPRFDWRGHGLGKAARLAKWTFFFVLANQAGYLVITQIAVAAGIDAGDNGAGLSAFSNALLIWQLPHAVIAVSIMSAVLPRLSRAAADEDAGTVRDDLSYGLRTTAVAIIPGAFLFLSLGPAIARSIYAVGGQEQALESATNIGLMLSAFALGLIPYSMQYVMLRGFYAYEDTRTPFSNTVWVAGCQAGFSVVCYLVLPSQWVVTGMAFGYGAAYAVGVAVAIPKLKRKIGGLDTKRIGRTYSRLAAACVPAAAVGIGVSLLIGSVMGGWLGSVLTVLVAGALQLAVFAVVAKRLKIEELNSMLGMVRGRLGR